MATGNSYKSVVVSSEEVFDNCCTPCEEKGKTRQAKHLCVDCGLHFCDDCLEDHNKYPALRSHQIVDKPGKEGGQKKEEKDLPTERCAVHHGKLIDMFCGDHDEVCCAACIAIKHRACVNVDYLPDIAEGVKDGTEFKDTLHSLKEAVANLKEERETKRGNLTSLDQDRDKCLKDVEKCEGEIIQKIQELSKAAKQEVCSKYDVHKKEVQSDLDTLNKMISTTDTYLQKLSSKNKAQLFAYLKISKKSLKDCETVLNDLSGRARKDLHFTRSDGLTEGINSLGSVSSAYKDIKGYKATLFGKFCVASTYCQITGACAMDDGTYLMSDYTHTQLNWLDGSFTIKDQIQLDNHPYSIQRTGPKDAIVLFRNGTIQFVTIGDKLSLTVSFNIAGVQAAGPYNTTDEIFIFQSGKICIYKKSGEMIKQYENKDICSFSQPTQTAVSNRFDTIFLANRNGGLLAITRCGKTQWMFKDPELKSAWGVCSLPCGVTLVSGQSSNNVMQVDKNGRKIGVLIGPSENINGPFALAYDKRTSRLVVGCSSNEFFVYTLSEM